MKYLPNPAIVTNDNENRTGKTLMMNRLSGTGVFSCYRRRQNREKRGIMMAVCLWGSVLPMVRKAFSEHLPTVDPSQKKAYFLIFNTGAILLTGLGSDTSNPAPVRRKLTRP